MPDLVEDLANASTWLPYPKLVVMGKSIWCTDSVARAHLRHTDSSVHRSVDQADQGGERGEETEGGWEEGGGAEEGGVWRRSTIKRFGKNAEKEKARFMWLSLSYQILFWLFASQHTLFLWIVTSSPLFSCAVIPRMLRSLCRTGKQCSIATGYVLWVAFSSLLFLRGRGYSSPSFFTRAMSTESIETARERLDYDVVIVGVSVVSCFEI